MVIALALIAVVLAILASSLTANASTPDEKPQTIAYVMVDSKTETDEPKKLSSTIIAARFAPLYDIPDEMRYFAWYESQKNYDQGFCASDDYHTLGFYQFDHRYDLQDFILACYKYDPATYGMFAQFESISAADFKYYNPSTTESAIRYYSATASEWGFTDLGTDLNEAWHAAYAADPAEFAALQDAWAYIEYYIPACDYLLAQHGIDLDERADCVRGLCWGMSNLFGPSGWQQFVEGANITADMTDTQLVTALCDCVVAAANNGYGNWGTGYAERYEAEKSDCLKYLEGEFVLPYHVISKALSKVAL